MKQNGFWKGFGSGLVLTVLIAALCVTATATSKRSIQVEDGIGITLNGARFTPRVWTCPSTRPPARSS